jgi:hypothetical protein
MVYAHKVALCAARHEQLAASAAAAGASTQLLSLLLSCIKYCSNSIGSEPASCLESLEVAWLTAKAAMQLSSSSQPSSSSSSGDSSSTMAAVVVGRSLHLRAQCFAVLLKHNAALAAADVRIGAKMPARDRVQRLLEQLFLSLKWVEDSLQQQQQQQQGCELAADAKGNVRQQLLQQLQVLQQATGQAQQRSSSSSSREQRLAGVAKAVLGDGTWVHQLQEFAELLCANVLPQGPLWCNNPSCRYVKNHAESVVLSITAAHASF